MRTKCQIIKMAGKDNWHGNVRYIGFENFKHWHSEIELVFAKSGNLTIELGTQEVLLQEGQLLIIASNSVHTFLDTCPSCFLYIARIPAEGLVEIDHLELSMLFQKNSLVQLDEKMIKIFADLIFADYQGLNELYTLNKTLELGMNILNDKGCIKASFEGEEAQLTDITYEIQRFIEKSLNQKVTLTMMAEHLGLSESYCSKIVKKKTNFNFVEYVNHIRLREAEKLLRSTDRQMLDICFEVGFNSVQSFNRNFKKSRGVSPSDYRKGLKVSHQ